MGVFAKRDDEIVHQKAVGAGDFVVCTYGLRKAAQDEKAIRGKFARVFCRRIITRRKSVRKHLNKSRTRLFLKTPQHFSFAGRDKAGNRDHAFSRFFNYVVYRFAMFFDGFLSREPNWEEKGRCEEREVTDGIPNAIIGENRMVDIAAPDESVGVALFPESAGGIKLNIAPKRLKLARRKGEHKPELGRERRGSNGTGLCRKETGLCPEPRRGRGVGFWEGLCPEPRRGRDRWLFIQRGSGWQPRLIDEAIEFMYPANDIEGGGFIVVYDQKQVDMVGHYDEIGSGYRFVARMGRAPYFGDNFANRRERNRAVFIDAREDSSSLFRTDCNKEEFSAALMEIQFHGSIIANRRGKETGLCPEPRRGRGVGFCEGLCPEPRRGEGRWLFIQRGSGWQPRYIGCQMEVSRR